MVKFHVLMDKKFRVLRELSSQIKEPFVNKQQNIFKYWRKDEVQYTRIKYTRKHTPIAFACLVNIEKVYKTKCYMLIIGCLPKYQRRGITTKLIKSILKEAKKDKCPIVFHVLKGNYKSNSLFEKLSKEIKISRMPELDFFDIETNMEDLVFKFEL